MNNQSKFLMILAVLIIVLLAGGGIMGFIYWQKASPEEDVNSQGEVKVNQPTNQSTTANVNVSEEVAVETPAVEVDEETYVQQLAKSFTERYGSFSNQNDYENLLDLKIYMTQKMQKETDDFIAANQAENSEASEYYGITTKVLSLKKLSGEGDQVIYSAVCQRKESKGLTGKSKTNQETAKVEFKKVDGQWKVYSFTWL